ncbi:MAG: hypothetical protein AVDCRST_MAG73-3638 [uncultured Thermomicrobiales bacterium]|uniref:Uncharacterized protein n=1 Tax=uncultured Thermomicrobiales bacterium TaxID=1645740 RepID=A0A6J4UVD1_9BACT|nr:MAG: hypothetical protein AVDCRST_MAG73-3638 [uncultured Thermomicrobiales bacterium]
MDQSTHDRLTTALRCATDWLVDIAQVGPGRPFGDPKGYPHADYTGAMRTEYDTKTRRWTVNGPAFHTGQAVRALLVAAGRTGDTRYREAAIRGGAFLLRERIDEAGHPQRGLLLSLEQNDDEINVQVTWEALSGLLDLHEATGDGVYLGAVRTSADLLLDGAYLPEERLMRDHYSLRQRAFVGDADNELPGRAMLDDAVLLRLSERTGEARYREAFLAMADRLLEEEGPPGTWLRFPPWRPEQRKIHNRKSWWWGHPLLAAFDATGDERYLAGATRAGDWYLRTQTVDGALYYAPDPDERHRAFEMCTSVVAVAILFWADLWRRTDEPRFRAGIRRALPYLLAAQFGADAGDPDVVGAFFESPNPPDGTVAPGFQVRDLATVFGVRALNAVLELGDFDEPRGERENAGMPW